MSPGKGLWEMESGVSGKGIGWSVPKEKLMGTSARDCDSFHHNFQFSKACFNLVIKLYQMSLLVEVSRRKCV